MVPDWNIVVCRLNCVGPLPCGGLADFIQSQNMFDTADECCQFHYANSPPGTVPSCVQYSDVSVIEIYRVKSSIVFQLILCIDYKRADRSRADDGANRCSVSISFG